MVTLPVENKTREQKVFLVTEADYMRGTVSITLDFHYLPF